VVRRTPAAVLDGLDRHVVLGHLDDVADREHRPEVGGEAQLDLELDGLAPVEVDVDALAQARGPDQLALQADLQRLQRQLAPVRQLHVGVGQLVDPVVARGRRGDEQPRRHARDAQLVARQVAAVVDVEPEWVLAAEGDGAVAQRHQEHVVVLEHDRVGERDDRPGGDVRQRGGRGVVPGRAHGHRVRGARGTAG
jgi:hypothetical protein